MFKKIFPPIFYINNWWLFYLDLLHFLKDGKVQYQLRNGKKLYVATNTFDSRIINEIWGEKVYALNFFQLKNAKVIMDLGAHKGYFSIYAANKFKNAKIFAIEPLETNYTILRENIKVNKLKNITVYPYGISDKTEKSKLYRGVNNSGGVSMIKDWYIADKEIHTFNIKCITMESLIKKEKLQQIDLLKLDVEGFEYTIFSSFSPKIFNKIKNITMEYHQIGSLRVEKIVKLLKKHGFSVKTAPMNDTLGMLYAKRIR